MVSIAVRLVLFNHLSASAMEYLSKRIENMSPVTSFPRIVEGFHLVSSGITSPYVSGYFKLNPISASVVFAAMASREIFFAFLVTCNLLSGWFLAQSSGLIASIAFLLNPYTLVSELGLSAEALDMLALAVVSWAATRRQKLGLSTLLISFVSLNKPIVPYILIFPLSLIVGQSLLRTGLCTLGWTVVLHILCFILTGGSSTYLLETTRSLFLITPDLEPTMGYAWNLLTMSFSETVPFFRLVIYGHIFLVSVVVFLRFRKLALSDSDNERVNRYFHVMIVCVLVFQPYPTGIDYSLIGSLLMSTDDRFHDKLSKTMSIVLVSGQLFTSAVGPLWLERNTGNANFLYYLSIVSTFVGIISAGQCLRVARLADYSPVKKSKAE